MNEVEKRYLTSLIEKANVFEFFNDGMYIMGNLESDETTKGLVYLNDIDGWLRNINYLIEQINESANTVMNFIERENETKFSFWGTEHSEAFYYTENIMFRLTILWDLLAQLCNTVFKLNEEADCVSYKKFFKKYNDEKYEYNGLKEMAELVVSYISEEENDEKHTNPWNGNHTYVNNLRNSFTHRLNPHIVNFHNASFKKAGNEKDGMTFPVHPLYEIKRMLEDYNKAYIFISTVRKKVVKPI